MSLFVLSLTAGRHSLGTNVPLLRLLYNPHRMGLSARLRCPLLGFDSMKRLSVCIVLLLLSSSTAFAEFTGLVVSILVGDTITALKDGKRKS
jgi:hypothetical protein